MKLIVGLGNPGKEYENTRHNTGYLVIDNYLGNVKWQSKFESLIYETELFNEKVIFVKPTTYMNLSGIAIRKIYDYYKMSISDIFIIQDDITLDIGKYRIKINSSSGGHNGIKSIIKELNTEEFARLKIGIGMSDNIPIDKYVLGKFTKQELEIIISEYQLFNEIINSFIKNDIDTTMMLYNKK